MNLDAMIHNTTNLNDKYEALQNTVINILDRHAPKKQKTIKKTDFHCMTTRLRKAILIQNQFRNKFFTHRSLHFLAMYRKHRNNVTLIKKEEIRKYFEEKCQGNTKNKDFWRAFKPVFSETKTKVENIPIKEDNNIITDCKEVCKLFNRFFREIGSEIGNIEDNNKPIDDILSDYANHTSVKIISTKINHLHSKFEFKHVTELSSKKASGYDEIPLK